MDILDKKSEVIHFFFTGLEEMLDTIGAALKHRTPRLNGEKFLTGKDVCRMLHISVRTLQEWRTRGKIPFLRLKGKILYKESEILKWLGNNYLPTIE
jgi:excisionase family DNA binding protein